MVKQRRDAIASGSIQGREVGSEEADERWTLNIIASMYIAHAPCFYDAVFVFVWTSLFGGDGSTGSNLLRRFQLQLETQRGFQLLSYI